MYLPQNVYNTIIKQVKVGAMTHLRIMIGIDNVMSEVECKWLQDNLNDMEVRDKFDLSRIVIWIVFDDKMTFVAEVACVTKRLIVQEQVIYNITCLYV